MEKMRNIVVTCVYRILDQMQKGLKTVLKNYVEQINNAYEAFSKDLFVTLLFI